MPPAASRARLFRMESSLPGRPRANAGLTAAASVPLLLLLVHATNDAFTGMLAALLPTLRERLAVGESTLALFVATLSFSSSVLQPLLGGVADRVGRRTMAVLGIVTSSVVLSLMGIVPSAVALFALLLVGGLGSAAFHPAGTALMRQVGGGMKELAVAAFSSAGTIGLAFGPVVILTLVRRVGLQASPVLMIPGVVLGVALALALPRTRAEGTPRRIAFLDPRLVWSPIGLLSLAGILRSLSFVTFNNAVPLWLVEAHGVAPDAAVIAATLAAFSVGAGVGGLGAGALATRFSRRTLMVGAMALAAPAMLAIFVVTPGTWAYYLVVVLGGVLANAAVPLLIVSAQDLAPGSMGAASGMLMGFTWGSAGVLYLGIGVLQETIGLASSMALAFAMLLPAALIAGAVLARERAVVVA